MHPRMILLTGALLVAPAAFGQSAFEPIASAVRSQALSLPAETAVVSLTPADKANPRQAYTIRRSFAADGTFTVAWKNASIESFQTFRADGTLVSVKQSDSGRGVALAAQTAGDRSWVKTTVTQDGKTKSEKKTDLKAGIVLRDELQHLILQAWQYGVRDGLKFQSLSPDGGMVGDFQIVFSATADPTSLSNKYTFPDEFKAALRGHNNYVVADMSLQGVGAFFYPHHFYLVYLSTPGGLEWRGYFGEDPKAPVFQYKVDSSR
jgi:membrane-bound inhibitor of C-type lysozyme